MAIQLTTQTTTQLDPVEDLVGDLFVDRQPELDFFWKWATRIPSPLPHDSHALVGRRRTGKTSILVKLYNRLYHEQDRVLPIFISFAKYLKQTEPLSYHDFAEEYFSGYLRSYLAFRHRQPLLLRYMQKLEPLRQFADQVQDQLAQELLTQYDLTRTGHFASAMGLADWVINFPHGYAASHNLPTVILIDEFQVLTNVINPDQGSKRSLTDAFQHAAETHWAPLLVSGSAVSTLISEALGGGLSGRIRQHHMKPLPQEYAYDLVFRLGQRQGVAVNEDLAEAIWQVTAGYANAINSLLVSASPALERYPALDALEEVVAFELSDIDGVLWQHYYEEFSKYSKLLNGSQLTKKVMFWTTKYPNQPINAEQIATELGVSIDDVQAALRKLYQIDIVKPHSLTRYNGPSDPMLRRYIEYNHYVEIENLAPAEVIKDWKKEYARLRGTVNALIGEVGEVYVQGVMHLFDDRTVDGETYFNQKSTITLPKFNKLERRGGIIKGGAVVEMDLLGEWIEAGNTLPSLWLVQVKNMQTSVGEEEARYFLAQSEKFVAQQTYAQVVRWYFCKSGFTRSAEQIFQAAGVLYSDLTQFNQLAKEFNFFGLP